MRITHLWCNVERNSGTWHGPQYMRARLSQILTGTPIPEETPIRPRPYWSRYFAAVFRRYWFGVALTCQL